jgi:hypothetical protein
MPRACDAMRSDGEEDEDEGPAKAQPAAEKEVRPPPPPASVRGAMVCATTC